jgi:hypothetical protein
MGEAPHYHQARFSLALRDFIAQGGSLIWPILQRPLRRNSCLIPTIVAHPWLSIYVDGGSIDLDLEATVGPGLLEPFTLRNVSGDPDAVNLAPCRIPVFQVPATSVGGGLATSPLEDVPTNLLGRGPLGAFLGPAAVAAQSRGCGVHSPRRCCRLRRVDDLAVAQEHPEGSGQELITDGGPEETLGGLVQGGVIQDWQYPESSRPRR